MLSEDVARRLTAAGNPCSTGTMPGRGAGHTVGPLAYGVVVVFAELPEIAPDREALYVRQYERVLVDAGYAVRNVEEHNRRPFLLVARKAEALEGLT